VALFVTIGYGDEIPIIEAATLEEAIDVVSRTPCAVNHGVVEVWPLEQSR
jgi:hypothetical protein